jgi:hypothetical protein
MLTPPPAPEFMLHLILCQAPLPMFIGALPVPANVCAMPASVSVPVLQQCVRSLCSVSSATPISCALQPLSVPLSRFLFCTSKCLRVSACVVPVPGDPRPPMFTPGTSSHLCLACASAYASAYASV